MARKILAILASIIAGRTKLSRVNPPELNVEWYGGHN